jgi:1,4-alpha-glucan branching enzyme
MGSASREKIELNGGGALFMRSLHNYHPHRPNGYSAKSFLKPVPFTCLAPHAKEVCIMGDFNDWDPAAHPLKRMPDGAWRAEIPLSHGHHHYLFVVDGKPTLDPQAQGIARHEGNEKVSLVAVS